MAENDTAPAAGEGPAGKPKADPAHPYFREHDDDIESASTRKPPAYVVNSDSEKPDVVRADEASQKTGRVARLYRRYRWVVHILVFFLFTGWWIASLVLHRKDMNWLVPFLFWLAISLRLLFFHVPISYVSRPIKWTWQHSAVAVYDRLPPWSRTPLGAFVTVAAVLVGTFVTEESADNNRENRAVSLFGLVVLLFVFWVTSRKRSAIQWRTVIGGMLAQYVIALFVLRSSVGYDIFKFIADRASDLLGFARDGTAFLTDDETSQMKWFLISVIPAIMFFVSIVQVLYYVGFLQWFIEKFAHFVFWMLRVSGAEAVVAAATPFIGQGESALLVRPFVAHMTDAEIHQILTCGFATISGSVLVAYMSLGLNPQALVSSCIMSIPASLAISKMRYPETEETLTAGKVVMPEDDEHRAENALHAFANGAWFGIKIAGTIIATLLCIIAAVGLIDGLLSWWGRHLDINDPQLTLELILGYVFYPVAFLLGVPRTGDLYKVARIIATKVIKVCPRPSLSLLSHPARALTSPSPAERIRRLHRPPGHRALPALPPHRHLRHLRLRQHRLAGHPDRHPLAGSALARRRRQPAGVQRVRIGRAGDADERGGRGAGGFGRGVDIGCVEWVASEGYGEGFGWGFDGYLCWGSGGFGCGLKISLGFEGMSG